MSQNDDLDFQALEKALSSVLSTLEPLRIGREHLDVSTASGGSYGGFGEVFQGRLKSNDTNDPDWRPVAVKQLRMAQGQDLRIAVRLAREMKVWADLKHPNVVPFVGFHLDPDAAWLISEWASKGNAYDYLLKAQSDFKGRVKLLLDAAEGLAYLHGLNPPVCHGDIKSANVLVTEDIRGMLGDFGLSRVLEADPTGLTTSKTIKGSMRYMSPELVNEGLGHTLQSDIWAFGCLALEILTGQHPFHKCQSPTEVIFQLAMKKLPAALDQPPITDLPAGLVLLIELCWKEDPSARPSMTKSVEVIRHHLQPDANNSLDVTQAVLLPREFRKEGEGWSAKFNPTVFPSFDLLCLGELFQTTDVQFLPDGGKFAAIEYDGRACIVNTPTGEVQVVFDPSPGQYTPRATEISLSRNGELISVATPASITVWDVPSATIAHQFDAPDTMRGIIAGMKLSGNGQVVAYTESRAVIHAWNMVTNEHRSLLGADSDKKRYMGCWPMEVSFDGRYVAVGSPESRIGIYSTSSGQLVEVLSGHKGPVSGILWSADGSRLLSGSWDKSVKLWDVSPLQDLETLGESLPQLLLSGSGTSSGPLSRRGSICRTTFSATAPVEWIFMSHDESWYISCSADGDVEFWDPKSGVSELKMKLQGLRNN
ncbi:hypothetical protein FRB90_004125, partial [Tulasnella sp. 427]